MVDYWSRQKASAAPAESCGFGEWAPTRPLGYWPKHGASADQWLRCDALGCVYRAHNHVVAIATRGEALLEDCRLADVVVSLVPVARHVRLRRAS